MSNRSALLSILSLCLGLALMAAANAQTAPPATSTSPTQASPGAAPQNPAPQSPNAPSTQNGAAPQSRQASPSQGGSSTVEDELQLTQDQKEKIAAVVDDENRQISTVRNDNSMSMEQKQQKVMQIRQEGSPKIKAVLSPEQLQKLAVIQERMRQQQGNGASAPSSPQTPSPQSTPQH